MKNNQLPFFKGKVLPVLPLKYLSLSALILGGITGVQAQKPALDHSVYDQWQSFGKRELSNNGAFVMYSVNVQQGDNTLFIESNDAKTVLRVERGDKSSFTAQSTYAVFNIIPTYEERKQVRIKKIKESELTNDSLGIYNLKTGELQKIPMLKEFKVPEKNADLVAYLVAPAKDSTKSAAKSKDKKQPLELVLQDLKTKQTTSFEDVVQFYFDPTGSTLVYVTQQVKASKDKKESTSVDQEQASTEDQKKYGVYAYDVKTKSITPVLEQKQSYAQFEFAENGSQVSFIASSDKEEVLVKEFEVYVSDFKSPARLYANNTSIGMPKGWSISEFLKPTFSENAKRLFVGIAPTPIAKDTTLIDEDHAVVDIWHFNEDVLQTTQLARLKDELKRAYVASVDLSKPNALVELSNPEFNRISFADKHNAPFALLSSDYGFRVQRQWDIQEMSTHYVVEVATGKKELVVENLRGRATLSALGNAVIYFDAVKQAWFSYDIKSKTTKELTKGMDVSFTDELYDQPSLANAYGIAGFTDNDESVLIRDRYDIWEFFLHSNKAPRNITKGQGRTTNTVFNLIKLDKERLTFKRSEPIYLSAFNEVDKKAGIYSSSIGANKAPKQLIWEDYSGYNSLFKAKDAQVFGFLKESFEEPTNLFVTKDFKNIVQLSDLNTQQSKYNWGTSELVQWTTPNGFSSQGVVYKPEDFDPNKKYPMIVYFYERLSDNLHRYEAPAPTPSRLNIPYFVSNGYIVFTPDIAYQDGYPGKAAEEFINSGVNELVKQHSWIDASKIAIQGQSWGGYQVAHLITVTDMYAAAWSGAPVVNMTSAYGGIRWTTGMSRQFQYEQTQSRIGKDLWSAHELYIENSPLFAMPNVKTPVVIMHNDQDGAVPWYQGIEMFMALRRLGKPAWLLNYNGDDHNLIKRQNRKDIQRRQQQFFDHYLKGAKAPVWMVKGVPATMKGKDWGFDLTDQPVQ